jgi:transcriptional regulator of arginine metabolism
VFRGGLSGGPLGPLANLVESVERSKNLIVVKTPPGNAQGVARGLDEADWEEVMGTIAGDDTVLVICRTERGAGAVEARIRSVSFG